MKKILALIFALLATPVAAQTIPSGLFGSINYWGVGGLSQVLNPGLAGQCLTTQGVGSAPVWVNCQVSSLALLPPINTNQFYGNVSGQFAPPVGVDVNTILNTVGYDIARPPPVEAIIYKSNVGPLFNWQALPPSTQGSILTSGGPTNPPFWATNAIQANLSGICTTIGAVLYFDTPSLQWKCLAPGTSGQLLQTGGVGVNPSWLTVTLATLGGVPSTRNVSANLPLGGGGALSADLTLTCATCATTTTGGPLSATSPVTISSGGVIAVTSSALTSNNDTNVTITLGGTPASALLQPASITMGWTGTLSIARGGTGAGTQTTAFNALAPTPTRAGDVTYWNGTNYVNLAGNNSGTQVLSENASGVPAWTTTGAVPVIHQATATFTTSASSTTSTVYSYQCTAGGGGSGGSAVGAFASGGGGAGETRFGIFSGVAASATVTITTGTGGTAGASGATAGGTGNASSIAATGITTITANGGGGGGVGGALSGAGPGGSGGAGGTSLPGGGGGAGATVSGSFALSGLGGASSWGGGGASTTNGPGTAGAAPGSGAGGSSGVSGAVAGAVGANGLCVVSWIL